MKKLCDFAVGDTLSLKVSNSLTDFLVVHQGNPDPALYDASCDGTWLMMKDLYAKRSWSSLAATDTWLKGNFLPVLDSTVQAQVKTVKIPYLESGSIHSGSDGLETQIFLLSAYELGWTSEDKTGMKEDGKCLAYFEGFSTADIRRVASLDGTPTWYWTRSLYSDSNESVWVVSSTSGDCTYRGASSSYGLRPVLILPPGASVDVDGTLVPNSAPVITSPSGASGVNLGSQNAPFYFQYTPSDPDGDSLTITEAVDEITTRTWSGSGGILTNFEAMTSDQSFGSLSIGPHSLQVTASDGDLSTVFTASFEKAAAAASLTLASPICTDGQILSASILVEGSIPDDAAYSVQITNNALDNAPVWQDATQASKAGERITFTNQTAQNGWAFQFKLTVERGSSGTGGYIAAVSGTIRSAAAQ